MMSDRQKVLKGLMCCTNGENNVPRCEECPYADEQGTCEKLDELHRDALELLKTMEVVVRCKDCICCIPYNDMWQLPKKPDGLWCRCFNKEVEKDWYCHEGQGW